jgi:hypothetical protein
MIGNVQTRQQSRVGYDHAGRTLAHMNVIKCYGEIDNVSRGYPIE